MAAAHQGAAANGASVGPIMTERQRGLLRRLREEAPTLYGEAERALTGLPVGCSARVRLPVKFTDVSWAQSFDGPAILVTRTPRGLEYVEQGMQLYRKGWTRPRPRLLPMDRLRMRMVKEWDIS